MNRDPFAKRRISQNVSTSDHTRSVLKIRLNGYPFSVIGTRASRHAERNSLGKHNHFPSNYILRRYLAINGPWVVQNCSPDHAAEAVHPLGSVDLLIGQHTLRSNFKRN